MKRFSGALAALSLLALVVASPVLASPFQVRTSPVANVGAYEAELRGEYLGQTAEGGIAGFEYGTTTSYGSESSSVTINPSAPYWQGVTVTVGNLQPGTIYHYRIGVMSNKGEVTYGADRTFTTKSAPRFEAGGYYADVTATQAANNPLVLGVENGTFKCQEASATGRLVAASGQLTLTPTFTSCEFMSYLNPEVAMNGCQFVLHPGDPGGPTTKLDITCPAGKAIEIGTALCRISVPAQSGISPNVASNITSTTPDTVGVDYEAGGINYTVTKDGFLCAFNGLGSRTGGTLSGHQDLGAVDANGKPLDFKIGY